MLTLTVAKADVGGFLGNHTVPAEILDEIKPVLDEAEKNGLILDHRVLVCGDDIALILLHEKSRSNSEIHELAWKAFVRASGKAKELGLYKAGQDLVAEFKGTLHGTGAGVAEMSFEPRESEGIVVFLADKTEPGAWNLYLYRIFADPFNTPGLVISPRLSKGFVFEVLDLKTGKKAKFSTPEESYKLLALITSTSRFVISAVYTKDNKPAAVTSTDVLNLEAGRYVGKSDPVAIVRIQHEFPALGEVLEPFATPYLVKGWMRGSLVTPLLPVSFKQAKATRMDGPARVISAGFHVKDRRLLGPEDLFADIAFDPARRIGNFIASYLRLHGVFEPARLSLSDMQETTLPEVLEEVMKKFGD